MKPFRVRLCIVLWVLWGAGFAVSAFIGLFVNTPTPTVEDAAGFLVVFLTPAFFILLLQYLLTGWWSPRRLWS